MTNVLVLQMKLELPIQQLRRTGEFRLSVVLGTIALAAYLVALLLCTFLAALDQGLAGALSTGCVVLGFLANLVGFFTACIAVGTERRGKLGCLLPLGLNTVPPFLVLMLVTLIPML